MLFYFPTIELGREDRRKLCIVDDAGRAIICPDGEPPGGLIESVEAAGHRGTLAGIQMHGEIRGFPIIFEDDCPPKLGPCLIAGQMCGTAVKVLAVKEMFPSYELLVVDDFTRLCNFRFAGEYRFGGDSIIFR